jgi:zinc D-Ala-D-Ala carboxypeptidase
MVGLLRNWCGQIKANDCNAMRPLSMKPAPTRRKRPPTNRLADFLQQRIWFFAIVFITAGLVLILGGKLEQLLSSPPPIANQPVPTTAVRPPATIAPGGTRPVQFPTAKPASIAAATVPTIANPPSPKPAPTIAPTAPPARIARASVQSYFGHLPYDEAPPDRLVSIGKFERENYVREEALDREAAQAFQVMVDAARSQGVQLMGISGFRNIPDQQALFDKQIERRGSAEAASKLSAPPGHSEHHTGYALDITDASRTDVDLKVAFEETAAYQWLVTNAQQYGFEQSFPRNNVQGVSYEPWHWRYVGSARSAQVFAAARSASF